MIRKVNFDENSFGITQRSLKILRDTLARKVDHEILVVEVPTNALCCGYFIFDAVTNDATFTGDGFRLDRGGEGGAGYGSAEALLQIYGIHVYQWVTIDFDNIYGFAGEHMKERMLKLAQEIATGFTASEYRRPSENPGYYARRSL